MILFSTTARCRLVILFRYGGGNLFVSEFISFSEVWRWRWHKTKAEVETSPVKVSGDDFNWTGPHIIFLEMQQFLASCLKKKKKSCPHQRYLLNNLIYTPKQEAAI